MDTNVLNAYLNVFGSGITDYHIIADITDGEQLVHCRITIKIDMLLTADFNS